MGFLFATANVVSMTAINFFHLIFHNELSIYEIMYSFFIVLLFYHPSMRL